jgi:hypothetical protein
MDMSFQFYIPAILTLQKIATTYRIATWDNPMHEWFAQAGEDTS